MKIIQTDNALKPNGHYSQAIIQDNTMYISGQLSINPDTGKIEQGNAAKEAKRILSNIDLILNEARIDKNHILKCTVYISDISLWDMVNDVYSDYFKNHKPARVIVPTSKLHFGCSVEIEAIAAINID